jgi:hypothetical protein
VHASRRGPSYRSGRTPTRAGLLSGQVLGMTVARASATRRPRRTSRATPGSSTGSPSALEPLLRGERAEAVTTDRGPKRDFRQVWCSQCSPQADALNAPQGLDRATSRAPAPLGEPAQQLARARPSHAVAKLEQASALAARASPPRLTFLRLAVASSLDPPRGHRPEDWRCRFRLWPHPGRASRRCSSPSLQDRQFRARKLEVSAPRFNGMRGSPTACVGGRHCLETWEPATGQTRQPRHASANGNRPAPRYRGGLAPSSFICVHLLDVRSPVKHSRRRDYTPSS